jgi:aryl-alcohol dehydrogenase-like predicted oxidoreductase
LLTGKIAEGYTFGDDDNRKDHPWFEAGNIRQVNALLDRIRGSALPHGATLAQLALAWTFRQPGVTASVTGMRNPRQAEENCRAADLQLSEQEWNRVERLLAEFKE